MAHEPETDAARYLGDDLGPDDRQRFSRHLLSCADCRSEVEQARRGRALLEAQRRVVPTELRDRMRALVDTEPAAAATGGAPASRRVLPRRSAAVVAVAASVAAVLAAGVVLRTPEPTALRQAVQDYAAGQLPGAGLPDAAAPDLTTLRLQPVGAGGGTYAGLDVDGYAYRDPAGRRVVLYLSDRPFPEAPDARRLPGSGPADAPGRDSAWIADRGDVVILCARLPHSLLVVGEDRALVRSAARALGVL